MVNTPGWTSVLWFVAILAAIPLLLWLLRRSPLVGGQGVPGAPKPVAVMPLSPSQKLVTIEVGQGNERLWLVLGVTPQAISTLHTMLPQTPAHDAAAPAIDPHAPPAAAFAQLLRRIRQGGGRREG